MLKIEQFGYASDNFGYILYGDRAAAVVDGGAVENILAFLDGHGLKLEFVANTHQHADHTQGTRQLLARTGAPYLDNRSLRRRKELELERQPIQVLHTPGHTEDSLCFYFEGALVSGDTLFNGTIGNCFSGDLKGFLNSIKRLMALPLETAVWAGHNYIRSAMAFARSLEPDNRAIAAFVAKADVRPVRSTLHEELQVNPYLRFNDGPIVAVLEKRGLAVDTEYRRWESLMSLE